MDDAHDHDVELDKSISQALAQAVDQVDPPAALRARVLASAGARTATLAPSSPGARAWPAWLAAAAMFAIAAGLSIYATTLRSRVMALEGQLREAILRADAGTQQLADVRRTASEAQSSVAVLTAPDLSRVELAGQTVAPGASARAFWSQSRGLVFTASNLPALPAGQTYQLWIVTAQAPVSVGLLKPGANGGVTSLFSALQTPGAAVAMAVTIEPEGGVPAPTGDKYLVGLVPPQKQA